MKSRALHNRFTFDLVNLEVRALQASVGVYASTLPQADLAISPVVSAGVVAPSTSQLLRSHVVVKAAAIPLSQDQVPDADDDGQEGDPMYEDLSASDRSESVGRDTVLNSSVFGGNREGDNVNFVIVGNASHGTVQLQANGFYTYTPNKHYVGKDSFTFKVTDPGGDSADSNVATVSIDVTPRAETITAKASVTWQCSPSGLSQWLGGTNSYGLSISAVTYDGATFIGAPTLTFDDPGVRAFFSEKFLITPNMTAYRQAGPNGTTIDAYVATADIKWVTSKAALVGLADLPDWIPNLFQNSLESYCESKFTLTISADGNSNADITDTTSSPNYFIPTDKKN